MPVERFYVNETLEKGKVLSLKDDEFHHLVNVTRTREGEAVELINGKGYLASARLEKIEKKEAKLRIFSSFAARQPSQEIILAQALPRLPRLEYILEKSVELGVTKIRLFPGKQSEKKISGSSHLERERRIVIAAMKQSGRLFEPELTLEPEIFDWKKRSIPESSFFGDIRGESPRFLDTLSLLKPRSLLIAIGPERGFRADEVSFMETSLGMKGIQLNNNILRTDTAAICALSIAAAFIA